MISEKNGDFLQWLRGFYFTVKEGGVGAAALKMGRTQSSVSHQIKRLEDELGIQMFDRSRRRLELTSEGVEVLKKAIQIFDTIREMEELGHPNAQTIFGQVNIVATNAVLLNYLPKFVTSFREKYPKIRFLLDSGSLDYIMGQVGNAEADLGIACPHSVPDHLTFSPLFETTPVLIGPKRDIWNIPANPDIEDVAHLPFISFPEGTSIEKLVSQQFTIKGHATNTILKLTHFEHIKSYVEMGAGVSILDEYTLTSFDHQRFRIYKLRGFKGTRIYGLITRKNGYLSPPTKAFQRELYS